MRVSLRKLEGVPKQTGRSSCPRGWTRFPGMISWKGAAPARTEDRSTRRSPRVKRPDPLGLKCDTITSPRRLVNTFIHQMIPDLLKRDKPIKVANNFKSWSTTRDISSEWG